MQILRQRFGPSVRGEVLQSTLQASSADAIREHNLRPGVCRPRSTSYRSAREPISNTRCRSSCCPRSRSRALPISISNASSSRCRMRRSTGRSSGSPSSSANRRWSSARPRAAISWWSMSREGVGEQEIPGASGKDRQIALGSGSFIPGFEEQLIGATAGEHRTVRVTFPEDYPVADLAGKEAVFDGRCEGGAPAPADRHRRRARPRRSGSRTSPNCARRCGSRCSATMTAASRLRLKRSLLDKLAEGYDFAVPPGMVDLEFDNIWRQYERSEGAQTGSDKPERLPDAGRSPSKPNCRGAGAGRAGSGPEARSAPTRPAARRAKTRRGG